jgi:hypothetical protein
MTLDAFNGLPDPARVWVYGFENPLGEADQRVVADRLGRFIAGWQSHGARVTGAYALLFDRFAVLSGMVGDGLSGCSIDSSVESFKIFRDRHGLDALNRNLVHYRDADGAIRALPRAAFAAEVASGRCGPRTTVFDLTIQTLGDLRAGRFEVPLAQAWHAKAFLTV